MWDCDSAMIETTVDRWEIAERRNERERRENHKEKQFSAEFQTSWMNEEEYRKERNQVL
jgi:hypothetical protein